MNISIMRTFISFNIDESLKNQISDIQHKVRETQKPASKEFIKWENKNKFHLTVFFLGEIREEKLDILIKELDIFVYNNKFEKFCFESNGINGFPDMIHPRVLFVELKDLEKKSTMFSKELGRVLKDTGFKLEKKYHPHITLARIKKYYKFRPEFQNINEQVKFDFKFEINKFHLMESKILQTGSVYKEIKHFDLKPYVL